MAVGDCFIFWDFREWDEVNCVCARDISNALSESANFVGKTIHPDFSILVQFDELAEF